MSPYQSIVEEVCSLAEYHVQRFDLDATTPVNVTALANGLEIEIVYRPCWDEPSFPAVAVHSPLADFRLIVANSLLPPADLNYAIAHEIGHIVQDHREPRRAPLEEMANVYARHVTMPRAVIMRQLATYGGNAMFLAGLNGVPVGAMRLRLQNLAAHLVQEQQT